LEIVFVPLITELLRLAKEALELSAGDDHEFDLPTNLQARCDGYVSMDFPQVSTDGQTLDPQQASLTAAGAEKVFAEKVSGAVTDRKALARAIAALGPVDVSLGHKA
jgi:Resolvase, N terminal domain